MAGVGEGFEGVRALRPASLLRRRAGLFRMGIESELDDNSGLMMYMKLNGELIVMSRFCSRMRRFDQLVAGEKIP